MSVQSNSPKPNRGRPLDVTIVIPARNEEKNLPLCLANLARFENIILVDSGSSDATVQIAEDAGAEVVQFEWDGKYPKKRNWFLQNHKPETTWVLFLDCDEHISEEFCDELEDTLQDTAHSAFWINYTNYFEGTELKHGVPQRKMALLKFGAGLFERIEEDGWSGLDMEIHEHPIVDGSIGEIRSPIDHRDFRGLEKFLLRHIDYAKWEAKRQSELMKEGLKHVPHLTDRQKFKYRHLGKWWYPFFYFAFTYFVKLGFLDGRAGFNYAFYKAWYFKIIGALSAEQNR